MSSSVKILSEIGLASSQDQENAVHLKDPQTGQLLQIKPTFIFNPQSQANKETAIAWSGKIPKTVGVKSNRWCKYSKDYEYDYVRNPDMDDPVKVSNAVTIRPNTPMNNLYLDDIDVRMEGGRAYKVCNMDDGTYFDIREDQILQAILKYGIQPGGKIGGSWVFAINHTQMKCYLEDGKEYQEALLENQKKIQIGQKITKGFVPGKVYTDKSGTCQYVFLMRTNGLSTNYQKQAVIRTKTKDNFFLVVSNNDIRRITTVYETNLPNMSKNDIEKKVKLCLTDFYYYGTNNNGVGYVIGGRKKPDLNANQHLGIKWFELKNESAYLAEIYLSDAELKLEFYLRALN